MSDFVKAQEKEVPGSHLMFEAKEDAETVLGVITRFLFKSAAWIGIYFLGYFDFSIAWLITPLILTVLRDHWKKEKNAKLNHARVAALTNEKTMIESRIKVEDLPSWVFFPDKERAEWINSIIQQLWPNIGHYTRKLIAESIEPAVKGSLENYGLAGFKFEKVVLGQIPPRITGIKVYDKNTNRNEIIMDMDLVFASDCDIKFSLKRMTAKISDLSLRGLLRVVFKPLVTEIPLIGGVQVYFLTSPEVDFDLGGIANALDAPGLSNIIRKIVLEQIGYFMVLPNKYTIALTESVKNKALRMPDTAGILRVTLHKAANLMKKDIGVLGMGKSDPFAVLTVGNKKAETKMIKNTVNPEWNFIVDFPIEVIKGQQLTAELWDHDDTGDNEFLGRCTVQTSVVAERGLIRNMWIDLEDIEKGKVLMSMAWMETTTDINNLSKHESDDEKNLTKCICHVYIDSCQGLEAKRGGNKPSPILELNLAQDSQHTWPQYYTSDPVYEQGFVFLVANPESDDLKIRVVDTHSNKNDILGFVTIPMSELLRRPGMEYKNMPFTLKGCKGQSTVTLAAQIRCISEPKPQVQRRSTPPLLSQSASPASPTSLVPAEQSEKTKTPSAPPSAQEPSSEKPKEQEKEEEKVEEKTEEVVESDIQKQTSTGISSISDPVNIKDEVVEPRPPAIDEVIGSTLTPLLTSSGAREGINVVDFLSEGGLRQRNVPSGSPCGKIKLSLSYDEKKERLHVIVHQASGLPGADLPDPPDPYVKLYLLPERSKKSKRKSEVIKDTTNPVYDEEFTYDIPPDKLSVNKLEVSVVDKKGIFSRSPLMGRVVVDLMNCQLDSEITDWYQLQEEDDDSD